MRLIVLISVALTIISPVFSQDDTEFIFTNNVSALDVSSVGDDYKSHPMGVEVAKKMDLFKNRFTYIEPATPTSPSSRTVVLKPAIYNSIVKLNRYFKKEIKKGGMDKVAATDSFLKCLDIALILYAEETDEFEEFLRKSKSPEDIIEAYQKVVLK